MIAQESWQVSFSSNLNQPRIWPQHRHTQGFGACSQLTGCLATIHTNASEPDPNGTYLSGSKLAEYASSN